MAGHAKPKKGMFWGTQDTQFKLEANGMRCACLSGDMGKEQRQRVLQGFRQGCAPYVAPLAATTPASLAGRHDVSAMASDSLC